MSRAVRTGEKGSYNFYRVLRSVWRSRGISRTELAARHHLDKTTVSQIVGQLVDHGIVCVSELDTSNVGPGRRSEILTVNDKFGIVAGVEIRPDGIHASAVDMSCAVHATQYHRRLVERINLHEAVLESIERLLADERVSGCPLVGVGVGATGIVARHDRLIVRSLPLNISSPYDFGSLVARHLSVPVILDNDANCCAWGELVYDAERAPRNYLFLLLEFRSGPSRSIYGGDIGMGLGFVIDGSVYYGETGSAGEFRSLFWHPGFTNQFALPDSDAVDILSRPDELARLIHEIAKHVALLVNTLNLRRVYVGGDVAGIHGLLIGAIRSAIEGNWPYDDPVDCDVELATHAQDIVAIGAAAMVLEHIFEEPVLRADLGARNRLWRQILAQRAEAHAPAIPAKPAGEVR